MRSVKWNAYETKIYEDSRGYWVRLEICSARMWYRPWTNSGEVVLEVEQKNPDLCNWVDLETARKNLDVLAELCNLKLVFERDDNDTNS